MIVPVVLGAVILGQAFDLFNVNPTQNQIIDENDIEENLQIVPVTCSQKNFKIVKSAADVNEALNLDPFISLKVKNRNSRVLGLERYLTSITNRNETVEILMVVDLETETHSFPSTGLKTGTGWQDKPQAEVGTHYVSSIKYGGLLVISLTLRASNLKHLAQIEKAVTSKIPSSGSLDELFFKNLESAVLSVHKKAIMGISVFTTAGFFAPPTNVADLAKLVREYPNIVSRVNDGKGNPLRFELEDIHKVQPSYPRFEVKQELEVAVEEANEKFEDVRVASQLLRGWLPTAPIMKKEEEEIVYKFGKEIQASKEALSTAITNLHYNGESNQFEETFSVYNRVHVNVPYRYTSTTEKIIHVISHRGFFKKFYIWFMRWLKSVLPW